MLNNKTVAVVVPAYNEQDQIRMVLESMSDFVDRIVVVNDGSTDQTERIVRDLIDGDHRDYANARIEWKEVQPTLYNEADILLQKSDKEELKYFSPSRMYKENPGSSRIILISHLRNAGVGASIATGYKWCKDNNLDCTAVMAGDGQMDPSELESICRPVTDEGVDYVKGNRLRHPASKIVIPRSRFYGNSILSILTKIASGYWSISDTQTGYTAISLLALKRITLYKIYKKYGMPNDLLVKLNIAQCSIKEVMIKPVYRIGEKSKMKIFKVIPLVSMLLVKLFFKRIWVKYLLRDFHPLFLFYNGGILLLVASLPLLKNVVSNALVKGAITTSNLMLTFLLFVLLGSLFLFLGMWMDIQDNDRYINK